MNFYSVKVKYQYVIKKLFWEVWKCLRMNFILLCLQSQIQQWQKYRIFIKSGWFSSSWSSFFQYLSGNAGIDSDFFRWLEFFQSVEYEVNLAIVYSIQNLWQCYLFWCSTNASMFVDASVIIIRLGIVMLLFCRKRKDFNSASHGNKTSTLNPLNSINIKYNYK